MSTYLVSYAVNRINYIGSSFEEWDCISEENITNFEEANKDCNVIAVTKLDE